MGAFLHGQAINDRFSLSDPLSVAGEGIFFLVRPREL
jgi:hypothetical protein